jgi:hypothetical protein
VFRGIYIHGQVVDPDGAPAMAGLVALILSDGVTLIQIEVSDDGAFAIGPLVPGRYDLQASSPGVYQDSELVSAVAGEQGVVLRLVQGGMVAGFVVDAGSRYPVSARVSASYRGSDGDISIIIDGADSFRVDGLKPGTYDLFAESLDGKVGIASGIEVYPGLNREAVVIDVSPGAMVVLENQDCPSVNQCELYSGEARIGSVYLPEGAHVPRCVPCGLLLVRYRENGEMRSVEVMARTGAEQSVALRR